MASRMKVVFTVPTDVPAGTVCTAQKVTVVFGSTSPVCGVVVESRVSEVGLHWPSPSSR